jgi:hypothetical protein
MSTDQELGEIRQISPDRPSRLSPIPIGNGSQRLRTPAVPGICKNGHGSVLGGGLDLRRFEQTTEHHLLSSISYRPPTASICDQGTRPFSDATARTSETVCPSFCHPLRSKALLELACSVPTSQSITRSAATPMRRYSGLSREQRGVRKPLSCQRRPVP